MTDFVRVPVQMFHCLGCGEECDAVRCPPGETDLSEGTEIFCNACRAVHVIVPDGLKLTGERV